MSHTFPKAVVTTDLLPTNPAILNQFLSKGPVGLKARKWLVLIRPPASPRAYGRTSMDPNLDLLREIKGAVDLRKFNIGRALANPVSRKSLFFASESIPSAASKTRRSLPCANCKSTVKKASAYII